MLHTSCDIDISCSTDHVIQIHVISTDMSCNKDMSCDTGLVIRIFAPLHI